MERDRGTPLYQIGIAAQQVGLSARTLRIYEDEGLIRPARKPGSDQRLYNDQDLIWIRCISELIHGHSLTTVGIRRLLDLCHEAGLDAHLNVFSGMEPLEHDLALAAREGWLCRDEDGRELPIFMDRS